MTHLFVYRCDIIPAGYDFHFKDSNNNNCINLQYESIQISDDY